MPRVRSHQSTHIGTRTDVSNGRVNTRAQVTMSSRISDEVFKSDNHPLEIIRYTRKGGLMSGRRSIYRWDNYPALYMNGANALHPTPELLAQLPAANYPSAATETLQRTNPSRSSVDSLVALYEMREVPSLIKESWALGNLRLFRHVSKRTWRLLSRAAKLNLMVQFGILPMINDTKKILMFHQLVKQRVKELEKLRDRGLRRTVSLYQDSGTSVKNGEFLETVGGTIRGRVEQTIFRTIRGHARWHAQGILKNNTDEQLFRTACQAVYGVTFDPVTVWNMMPWTWLSDWFVDVSSYLQATRNVVGAIPETPRIMVTTETYTKVTATTVPSGVFITPFYGTYSQKTRRIHAAGLNAQLEFLSGNQASIIGSLAVLKGHRA